MGVISPETRQILLSISEDEWRRHYRELVIYAYARCRRWSWRTGNRENLPEGYSPEAIVQEAVARLYDGTRVWNHDQYPDRNPVPFLKAVVDSLVWALLSSAEHNRTVSLEQGHAAVPGDQAQSFQGIEVEAGLHNSSPLSPDNHVYLKEVEQRIESVIADRQDLIQLFEHLRDGLKPNEIAERMGLDVKRIYALRKTFDRRTAEIQRELFGIRRSEEAKKEGR
jgi:DNA-directed RNA polymerase specialized sigma24 family protein